MPPTCWAPLLRTPSGRKPLPFKNKGRKERRKELRVYRSRIACPFGRATLNHTWLMVFSICTKPRLGSVLFMKSTMVSRFSCCRIKGLWLPNRLKATLNMTSDPWRKIISEKTQKSRKLNRNSFWWNGTPFLLTHAGGRDSGKHNPKLPDPDISNRVVKIKLKSISQCVCVCVCKHLAKIFVTSSEKILLFCFKNILNSNTLHKLNCEKDNFSLVYFSRNSSHFKGVNTKNIFLWVKAFW